jgi:RNA polymerase sigma-70 factor (ECF subfamily)
MSTLLVTVTAADLVTIPLPAVETAPARETAEDRILVDAARQGDREAFGRLVDLHERAVLRAAMAALGSHEDAQEVAQEAFLVAWRRLSGFRGDATFRTWLLTIAWRKALDRRRRRRRLWQRRADPSREAADPLTAFPSDAPDPERAVVARDLVDRARIAIAGLSPKLRDTLLLAVSGQYGYQEIGAMLGVPLGTVKWRVAEARRQVVASIDRAASTRGTR